MAPESVGLFDVVHDVVGQVAPDELPLLSGLRQLDDAEIGRRLGRRGGHDDPLGFGVGEIVVLVTPILWTALQQVANQAAVSAADGMWARTMGKLRRKAHKQLPARFSHDDLATVRGTVLDVATKAGMKPARAEQLAASVVDRLMFPPADGT